MRGRSRYWLLVRLAAWEVQLDGQPVSMTLRISELFRRENDEWKLIHRHADRLDRRLCHAVQNYAQARTNSPTCLSNLAGWRIPDRQQVAALAHCGVGVG